MAGAVGAKKKSARPVSSERAFARYVWGLVGGRPRVNRQGSRHTIPARTAESDALSRALKERGFRFVGSTICYAFMQAAGMVNDHTVDCFRHAELARRR
jgi:DNA-3-methyladenine glycosylase I